MLYIGETGGCLRTRFGEHRRAVTSNDANQPVARHFNNDSHCVSDMKIRALCPISGSNDSRKRHEMRLISKLGTIHPLGINERFSYILTYLCLTHSLLIALRFCFLPHFVLRLIAWYYIMQYDLHYFVYTLF